MCGVLVCSLGYDTEDWGLKLCWEKLHWKMPCAAASESVLGSLSWGDIVDEESFIIHTLSSHRSGYLTITAPTSIRMYVSCGNFTFLPFWTASENDEGYCELSRKHSTENTLVIGRGQGKNPSRQNLLISLMTASFGKLHSVCLDQIRVTWS